MPKLSREKLPKYGRHRASGQAIVTLNGKDHYLGPHNSEASKAEYDSLISRWLAAGRTSPTVPHEITVVELLLAFRRHADRHYQKDGKPTGEIHNFDCAIVPLRLLYGEEPVRDFGPLKLKTIQALMAKGYTDPKRGAVAGLSRGVVNSRIGRIKRIFRWAVSEELAPSSLAHALNTVQGLQFGRTDCREAEPVGPVDDKHVEATMLHLPPVVADMVSIQRLTGARPGEICCLRPCDLDRTAEVWEYRPSRHKTQHHGRDRVIFIGPKAQEILRPYLLRDSSAICFQPAESEKKRKAKLREARKTPVQPSQVDRAKRSPKKQPGTFFGKDAFARAIGRAADLADQKAHEADETVPAETRIVPHWSPNQLRHTAATEIRRRFGLEAAQVCLGHSAANVTEVYAERNAVLGAETMRLIG